MNRSNTNMLHLLLGIAVSALAAGPAGAFTAYVSNEKSNTVSVIDTNTWKVVRTIKVGQRPRGIALTRDVCGTPHPHPYPARGEGNKGSAR